MAVLLTLSLHNLGVIWPVAELVCGMFLLLGFPYVAYLYAVQCCSFAFDKYVIFEGKIGVKVSSQVSNFCWSFDWFSYDI